jgi:spoIIIJ-associated protein
MNNPMSEGSAQRPATKTHPKDRSRGAQPERQSGLVDSAIAPEEFVPRLKAFLDLVMRELALAIQYEISTASESEPEVDRAAQEEAALLVRFSGEDKEILLARNGELLLALEYLAHRWLRLPPALHDRVRLECGDFRANRLEELKLSARVAAQRVRETGQPFPFNPMSSRDRRMVHLELTGASGVRTVSEGTGDRRHIVIYPANKK